jgi:unsaturated rhamnogalacturonyl hydrolase
MLVGVSKDRFGRVAVRGLVWLGVVLLGGVSVAVAQESPAAQATQKMAATVMKEWPGGVVTTVGHPGAWGYEEGTMLDGIAAEWHVSANGDEFKYIKEAVDRLVMDDGTIKGYGTDLLSLDEIEMGRSVMLVYRVTRQEKYYKAAKFIHEQLKLQPRTPSGGFWHKKTYPNQMWLDGAYMAEPFRSVYADTFGETGDWDDIAKELLLMDAHMRDPKTGLMKHGWDDSPVGQKMPWADPKTGLSPEVWARAMGWYGVALADVLDWFPKDNPHRPELIAALNRTAAAIVKYQDKQSGLWWQVVDKGDKAGNWHEASASSMYVYALAKGVRMGYLPQADEASAKRGWEGIQKEFITSGADGAVTLNGTVKVGGLGGKPYRSGTYEYYIGEKTGAQDAKGVGAYLLAGSEMEQAATEALGQSKMVLMDGWFNSQTRKNAAGQQLLFHYKWDEDSNDGDSFFGRAFQQYGAKLAVQTTAPTLADLKKAQIYIVMSPDIPSKNPKPNYIDKASGDAIEAWVKAGGVLLLFSNDRDNTEFEHFNTLSDRFGMHFNPVLSHHVTEPDHGPGEVMIPAGTGIFGDGFRAYMKDTSTITASGPAKAVVTSKGDVMIAVSHVGKGAVLGVVDPWFYNEYADGRKMREYDGWEAAKYIAGWAVKQSKR